MLDSFTIDIDTLDTVSSSLINTTAHYCGSWCSHITSYHYPATKYLYQIFCPKKGCNTANWLELETVKPCTKCKSNLRAVSKKVDYEVEVG